MPGTKPFFFVSLLLAILLSAALVLGSFSTGAQVEADEAVYAGATLWKDNGCEGCHTLFGYGGNFAPDLTHNFSQRGEAFYRDFFVNPNAYHYGQRNMPRLNVSATQMDSLVAFLKWVDAHPQTEAMPIVLVSGSGNVVAPLPNQNKAETPTALSAGAKLFSQRCASCHSTVADVVIVGPSLAGIGVTAANRVPGMSAEAYIRESIIAPSSFVVENFPDVMQRNFAEQVSSSDIDALITYLMSLEREG
ncbi:hypothetical protein MASR2M15_17950 [Anaerolineales bacterium]